MSQCKETREIRGLSGKLYCDKDEHDAVFKHMFHLDMTAEEIDALNERLETADRETSDVVAPS